jgi:hypothetical protein
MNNLRFAVVLLITGVISLSCQTSPAVSTTGLPSPAKDGTQDSRTLSQSHADNWQRMKDCAEQADRLLRRLRMVEGSNETSSAPTHHPYYFVAGTQSHYSPRFERCFLRIDLDLDLKAARESVRSGTFGKTFPPNYWVIYDAFEGTQLSMCNGEVTSFCHSGDCSACMKFTDERMKEPTPDDPLGIRNPK